MSESFCFKTIVTILIFLGVFWGTTALVTCPSNSQLSPCACYDGLLECEGVEVTQESINQLFSAVRSVNNLTQDEWLQVPAFRLVGTTMEEFDLTPLTRCRFELVEINYSNQLVRLTGPPLSSNGSEGGEDFLGAIDAQRFIISQISLNDAGVGNTFLYFSPNLKHVSLRATFYLTGGQYIVADGDGEDIEFLPGFGSLVNLETLEIDLSDVASLAGGQFKRNVRLQKLEITSSKVADLGEHALLIDEIDGNEVIYREISFRSNYLTNSHIHPNHGLQNFGGQTILDLTYNKFVYISEDNFKQFLYTNEENYVQLAANFFICDENMRWLHDAREQLEARVTQVDCQNDPGYNIFTTSLL